MTLPRKPKNPAFTQPVRFFPRHRRFGFGGCTSFGVFPRRFGFAGGFDCFGDGFFFDPFLVGAFSVLGPVPALIDTYPTADSDVADGASGLGENANNPGEQPVTLLQLLDGSMYGLTSYHVVGNELRYTTDYGARNSVPLERIDFTQTLNLNAERGVLFVLEPRSRPPEPEPQPRP
jgi:hypothetical protein